MLEIYWIKNFERVANWPLTWRGKADDLLIAADLLHEAYLRVGVHGPRDDKSVPKASRVLQPALLLRAAALEALLKGRAVRKGHRFVVGGQFRPIPGTGNGHDLVRIADATTFRLNRAERDLLSRLAPHLELGRYPVGKSWRTGLKKHPKPEVGHVLGAHYSSSDDATLARLIRRLRRATRLASLHHAASGPSKWSTGWPNTAPQCRGGDATSRLAGARHARPCRPPGPRFPPSRAGFRRASLVIGESALHDSRPVLGGARPRSIPWPSGARLFYR